jgi:ribosomal protein S18 acetylase RimI-like enzyme
VSGHFDGMVVIRRWFQSDIDYVAESVRREDWGYSRYDMERCWRYEPDGCFIAESRNKSIGHVFSLRYDKMGWVGLLIVNPEERGRGVGTSLMKAAINHLLEGGAETIRLEAAEKAVPLYRRLGFREEFDSLRFSKHLKQKERAQSPGLNVFEMEEKDIENAAEFDSKYFGARRLRVLQGLYGDGHHSCFLAREDKSILGYVMSRRIDALRRIGPLVCAKEKPKTARDLLIACINAVEEEETELRIGTPAPNVNATEIMEELGFQLIGKSIRMMWGENRHKGDVMGIYGIGGAEKG